ncbi:MAG: dephospho-CoA kinase [Cyanobacteria bacterium J06621_8]
MRFKSKIDPNSRRLIGLTGGIATGKTTVSNYLATRYGLPVLDADLYAREAVAQGSAILQLIFDRYGELVKLPDASLNRTSLGDIIFNDAAEKQWLEGQIHPFVRDRFTQELGQTEANTVILAIPLLFESKLTDMVTEIWVVNCDRSVQSDRLQQRNSLTPEQAETRIDNQLPLTTKIKQADVVLNNNSDLEYLYNQVDWAVTSKS